MTREDMLKKLKTINLRAIPTVATMDMGLQYEYATSEGVGTGFGGMGDWPAYMFEPVEKEKWTKIREAIQNDNLAMKDLEETGLDELLGKIKTIKDDIVPSEVLKGLLALPEDLPEPFYCFFDAGQWYDKYAERPVFFASEKELKKEFISHYVNDLTKWEDMDDDELKGWYDKIQDEMTDFAIYTFDPE